MSPDGNGKSYCLLTAGTFGDCRHKPSGWVLESIQVASCSHQQCCSTVWCGRVELGPEMSLQGKGREVGWAGPAVPVLHEM